MHLEVFVMQSSIYLSIASTDSVAQSNAVKWNTFYLLDAYQADEPFRVQEHFLAYDEAYIPFFDGKIKRATFFGYMTAAMQTNDISRESVLDSGAEIDIMW